MNICNSFGGFTRSGSVYALSFAKGKPLWVDQPVAFQVDTTNLCNAKCNYCNAQGDVVKKGGFMEQRVFDRVVSEVKANRWFISYFRPYMNGEWMLDRRMPSFTSQIKRELGCQVQLFSNGSLWDRRDMLLDSNVDRFYFTVSASSREGYKRIYGIDKFDDAVRMVRWIERRKRWNQRVIVNFVLGDFNKHELADWKRLFAGIEQHIRPLHVSCLQNVSYRIASGSEALRFNAYATRRGLRAQRYSFKRPCVTWGTMAIGINGEIMHCCTLPYEYNYGKVGEVSLADAWRRRVQVGLNHRGCADCNLKDPDWERIFERYVWRQEQ